MSLTESLVAAVTERLPNRTVETITVEVGRLSGVDAESMRFCFDVCVDGTPLGGACLEIIDVPGRAHCGDCNGDVELPDLIPLCECGSTDLTITAGQELRIKHVTVAA
jgi:hydrogenase nickel incorporation protein HypA/HybF